MKRFLWCLLLILLASCNTLYHNLKQNPEKFAAIDLPTQRVTPLIFRDEFNQQSISANWKKSMYWSGPLFNPEVPASGYYSPDNFTFTDSTVRLWTRYQPRYFYREKYNDTVRIDYSIGLLYLYPWISKGNALTTDFMVECRAKMPDGNNEWPAFWLTGYEQWPPEIDVFEYWNDSTGEFTSNFHFNRRDDHRQAQQEHRMIIPVKDGFHTYGLKVMNDQMEFYFDGFLFRKLRGVNPYLHKLTVIIQNGVHDDPGNDTYLEVDWIRIYRLQ
jgi:beta-glucanase (GH16 family)